MPRARQEPVKKSNKPSDVTQSNRGTQSLTCPLILGETDGFVPSNEQSRHRAVFKGPERVKVFLCFKHQTCLQISLSRAAFNVCILQTRQAVQDDLKPSERPEPRTSLRSVGLISAYTSRLFSMASWDC